MPVGGRQSRCFLDGVVCLPVFTTRLGEWPCRARDRPTTELGVRLSQMHTKQIPVFIYAHDSTIGGDGTDLHPFRTHWPERFAQQPGPHSKPPDQSRRAHLHAGRSRLASERLILRLLVQFHQRQHRKVSICCLPVNSGPAEAENFEQCRSFLPLQANFQQPPRISPSVPLIICHLLMSRTRLLISP